MQTSEVTMTPYGEVICGNCGRLIECNEFGDMPHKCPECGAILGYSIFKEAKQ